MNIAGKERQEDGIFIECAAEQTKEEGARGWVRYAGNFTFLPVFSFFNELLPIQRIWGKTYIKVGSNKGPSEQCRLTEFKNAKF